MNENIKSKALKILSLALDFNNTRTKCSLTGYKPTVFVDFSGHTCELDVQINHYGWGDDFEPETNVCIYLDESRNSTAEQKLDAVLETLKKLITDYEAKNKAASDGNR